MTTAIVTASYRGDLDRCRLLCDSIDRSVTGFSSHYIAVESADLALFRPLAGPKRTIVDERELLPWWLKAVPDPTSLFRRRIWLSVKSLPLRGWHAQQLRKIALAARLDDNAALLCDSDTLYVKPLDMADLWSGDRLLFYAEPDGIEPGMAEHRRWSQQAQRLLKIAEPRPPTTDYIAQALAWRTDTAREMLAHIEAVNDREWTAAIVSERHFSECLVYGRFVEEVENRPDRHRSSAVPICHTQWGGEAMNAETLKRFIEAVSPGQYAVGLQSFIGTDPAMIRRVAGLD